MPTDLISLAAPFLMGWLIALRAFSRVDSVVKGRTLLLTFPLGAGLGLGLSSLIYFVWLCFFMKVPGGFIWAELGILTLLSVFFARSFFRKKSSPERSMNSRQTPFPASGWIIALCLVLAGTASARAFIITSAESPQGDFDAWARWNRNARLIYRAQTDWKNAYSNLARLGHPDNHTSYPMLLPTLVSRGWSYAGHETARVPVSIAFAFTLGTALLLIFSLVFFRSSLQGWLAGVLLLATPRLIKLGAAQYADIPLAFFFLSTAVFLFLYYRQKTEGNEMPSLLFLAGFTTGLACWTKNEGFLFLVGVAVCFFLVQIGKPPKKLALTKAACFTVGALPGLAAVLYFRKLFAPGLFLFSQPNSRSLLESLTDADRLLTIGEAFTGRFFNFGGWAVSLPLLLGIYLAIAGVRHAAHDRPALLRLGGLLFLMLAGYFMIYLMTPYDLQWHLATSLRRLFIQLWPLALFVYFLTTNSLQDKQ